MNVRFVVTTCDKSMWAMYPYAYLFNTYWSAQQKVDVLCENVSKKTPLPTNFLYYPLGEWPMEEWTNGLIKYLHSIKEQQVIIMLDDYWLVRTVDVRAIGTFSDYMMGNPDILRIDLTTDRLYAAGVENFDMYGHYDFVSAPQSQYQMSLMPGLWNKRLLLEILEDNWTPWDVELKGTSRVNERPEIIVLGTRQNPVRIVNALRVSRGDINVHGIAKSHFERIKQYFPVDMKVSNFDWPFYPEEMEQNDGKED